MRLLFCFLAVALAAAAPAQAGDLSPAVRAALQFDRCVCHVESARDNWLSPRQRRAYDRARALGVVVPCSR